MNKEIIICVGISGSGKSTWSSNFMKENPEYLRINRDDIRKTLVGNLYEYYQRNDVRKIELLVNNIESELFRILPKKIIIDNTNLTVSYITKWLMLIDNYNKFNFKGLPFSINPEIDSKIKDEYLKLSLNFKFKLFDISLEEAKENVCVREGYELDISKLEYIDKQYQQYQEVKEYILENYKDKIIC